MSPPLRRFLWLLGLVGQIVLYYRDAPLLAPIAAKSNIGGDLGTNTFIFDATGVIFWCFVLLLLEGDLVPVHKRWLRYLAIGLCSLVTLVVVLFNFRVL